MVNDAERVYASVVASVLHTAISSEEFDGLQAESGWRAPLERLGGEVIVVAPIGGTTSQVTLELTWHLQAWQRRSQGRGLLLADVLVKLGDDRPAPDLAWWRDDRRPEVGDGAVASVPDLVVEVLSPRTRDNDLGVKRGIYEHAGVHEYWRVDPTDASVLVGMLTGRELIDAPRLTGDDRLTTSLLPGFEVAVAELFRPPR